MTATQDFKSLLTDFVNKARGLSAAQRLQPELVNFIYSLALKDYVQGHYESARSYFNFLTMYRPTEPKFLHGLALSHRQLGNYDEAIIMFLVAGTVDPLEPEYTLGAAECMLLSGEIDEAADNLDLVIQYCKEAGTHEKVGQRAHALKDFIDKPVTA